MSRFLATTKVKPVRDSRAQGPWDFLHHHVQQEAAMLHALLFNLSATIWFAPVSSNGSDVVAIGSAMLPLMAITPLAVPYSTLSVMCMCCMLN
jgi:hypothetical protein